MSAPILRARGLTVAYRRALALKEVDVDVARARITAVVGPNGAGKSTLLKASVGLLPRLRGDVTVFGRPMAEVRHRVGYMPQSAEVDWDFPATVRDVVMMGRFGGLRWWQRLRPEDRDAVNTSLERMGLAALSNRPVRELSGGQRQRTFVARILAQDPELLILDEPLAGVDMKSEETIIGVLRELRDAGRSIVLVHHDLAGVRRIADDVVLLTDGRVHAVGSVTACLRTEVVTAAYGLGDIDSEGAAA